jgi:hypothetical protein
MSVLPNLTVLATLLLSAMAAAGQTVYRCGNEYTRVPCADGKPVDTDNGAITARRAAEAREVAAREKLLAEDMVRERRAREAAQHPAMATSLGPSKPVVVASLPAKAKKKTKAKAKPHPEDAGDFVAAVPKAPKASGK